MSLLLLLIGDPIVIGGRFDSAAWATFGAVGLGGGGGGVHPANSNTVDRQTNDRTRA